MDDLTTMGIGGVAGFVFRHIAELTKAARANSVQNHQLYEESMKAAMDRKGGTWMRRGFYAIVAFSLLGLMIAGFSDKNIVLEYQLDRNFLGLFKWQVVKLKEVAGVVFIQENRTAFMGLISFYLGQGVR